MGKKLDALLGRKFKTFKFKPTVDLAITRLAILKKQRQARLSVARSDVIELLKLGHHERALIRVEQVIKEQNMVDVFAMLEGYCLLLVERVNLVEQEKVCPDELKEVISSLLYASIRCGELPELQEIRSVMTSRFGKEFAASAIELRNNCAVNRKMVQKLSTIAPSLENRLNMLKEMASENGIILQIEEASPVTREEKFNVNQKQNQPEPHTPLNSGGAELEDNLPILAEEMEGVECFSDSMKGRKKYKDVADAAQEAFKAAAYAAAAARAAVELSRSESQDPDDQNSPNSRPREVFHTYEPTKTKLQTGEENNSREIEDLNVGLGFEKIHPIQNYHSEAEEEEIRIENKAEGSKHNKNAKEFQRSLSASSSDSTDNILVGISFSSDIEAHIKQLEKDIVFDDSDNDTGIEQSGISLSRTHDLGFNKNRSSLTNEVLSSEKANGVDDEDLPEGSGAKIYYPSRNQSALRSQAGLKVELGPGKGKSHSAEGSRMQGAQHLKEEKRPISLIAKRMFGR